MRTADCDAETYIPLYWTHKGKYEALYEELWDSVERLPLRVTRTERGWAGHFICANQCRFRRNTLLECGDVQIVVSTVGLMENYDKTKGKPQFREIGFDRHYETMAFHADPADTRYHDADDQQVYFDSPWAIAEVDADDRANDMHEAVVAEITNRLAAGETLSTNNNMEQ